VAKRTERAIITYLFLIRDSCTSSV